MKKGLVLRLVLVLSMTFTVSAGEITVSYPGGVIKTPGPITISLSEASTPLPVCKPEQAQFRPGPCPQGYVGQIEYQNVSECPPGATVPVWRGWAESYNSCRVAATSGIGTVNDPIRCNMINGLGDFSAMGVSIARGSTTYFLVDPKTYGANPPINKDSKIRIIIEELGLSMGTTSGLGISVTEQTASGLKVFEYPQPAVTGGMSKVDAKFPPSKYQAGVKFLVEITEPNQSNTTVNIKWRVN